MLVINVKFSYTASLEYVSHNFNVSGKCYTVSLEYVSHYFNVSGKCYTASLEYVSHTRHCELMQNMLHLPKC